MAVVRTFARVDGSLAHVFGFQHLMLATARLFGQPEQWQPLLASTAERAWFWGNALNPLGARTTLRREGGVLSISGQKSFCSGSPDSDMLIVSALRPPEARLAIAAIPTNREGMTVHADWDNIGQRQTDSGSVSTTCCPRCTPEPAATRHGSSTLAHMMQHSARRQRAPRARR